MATTYVKRLETLSAEATCSADDREGLAKNEAEMFSKMLQGPELKPGTRYK